MSTHHSIQHTRRSIGPVVLALLGGLLLTLQLVLPATALASSARIMASSPPPADPAFARAEVSVVRLVVSYMTTSSSAIAAFPTPTSTKGGSPNKNGISSSVACTGLGVLVGSWTLNSTGTGPYTNWVLTDAALLNQTRPACAPTQQLFIAGIDIYPNTAYTNTSVSTPQSILPPPTSHYVRVNTGALLFSFTSTFPQPFVDVATQDTQLHLAIPLADAKIVLPSLPLPASQAQNFLTPSNVSLQPNSRLQSGAQPTVMEAGTPIINQEGQVVNIQTSSGRLLVTQANALLQRQPPQPTTSRTNPVQDNWNNGIDALFGVGRPQNLKTATNDFGAAGANNPMFQAATAFEQQAQSGQFPTPGPTVGTGPTPVPTATTTTTSPSSFFGIPSRLLVIGSVVLFALIVLLVVVPQIVRSRRAHRQELERFEVERQAAEPSAIKEAQRQQQAWQQAQAQAQAAQVAPPVNIASTPRPTSLPCSNCGQLVRVDSPSCPNCRYLLTPSPSGKLLTARPPTPTEAPTIPILPPAPRRSVRETQTFDDVPTLRNLPNGLADTDKRQPYTVERRNLSLAVGTRTNPGIKRKYKPNEDSLLAIQGPINNNVQPQQFGLFVVADGMGGHANGQDASRLAIQTIIDYMLPLLSTADNLQDEGFTKLLAEGVQQANQAVHRHNQEQRADMGTTMTAALVVGLMAYVANVGDSRTYLYREPEGLSKITRDHSVVASLVDAGVIKPDDIYTHPKRNQIYRSLGEKAVVEVDTFKVLLQPGDKLLLCSDGLWDMVRDPEIQRLMRAPIPEPAQTGDALIQAALEGGGEDNVSVIVVHVTEATKQTGVTSIQLIDKPDSVSVPNMPI